MTNGMPEVLKKISFIWVLIVVFVLKEALWVAVIPPREAPDELGHYGYVEALFFENKLPLLGETMFSQRVQMAGTEAVGWVSDGVTSASNVGATSNVDRAVNAAATIDVGSYTPGNQVNWIAQHPPFYYLLLLPVFAVLPHDNIMFSIFVLRLISVLLGAVTLYFGWKTLEKINPSEGIDVRESGSAGKEQGARSAAAVNAAIIGAIAFLPTFSYMSAVMNNDNLVAALAAVLVYLLVGCWEKPVVGKKFVSSSSARHAFWDKVNAGHRKNAFLIGLLLGILALTKTTALPFFGVALAAFVIRLFSSRGSRNERNRTRKQIALDTLIAFGVPLVFAGWWYIHNFVVFGTFLPELKDAVALNPGLLTANPALAVIFPEVAPHKDWALGFWDFLFAKGFVLEYFKNIWGAFGRFFTQLSDWQYLGIFIFTFIGLFGCFVSAINKFKAFFKGKAVLNLKAGGQLKAARPAAKRDQEGKILIALVLLLFLVSITWKIYEITLARGFLGAMHGRYFLPALLPFFYFFVTGWEAVTPKKAHPYLFAAMFALFIVNDVSAMLYVVIPASY
jgi:hypothetical protein